MRNAARRLFPILSEGRFRLRRAAGTGAAPAGGSEGAGADAVVGRQRDRAPRGGQPIRRDAGRGPAADAGRSTSGRASTTGPTSAKCGSLGTTAGTRSDASSGERSRGCGTSCCGRHGGCAGRASDSGTRRTTDGGPAGPADSGSPDEGGPSRRRRRCGSPVCAAGGPDGQASNACRRAQGAASGPAHRGPGRATQPDGPRRPPPPGRHPARFRPRSSSAGRRLSSRRRSQSPRASRARTLRRARRPRPPRRSRRRHRPNRSARGGCSRVVPISR